MKPSDILNRAAEVMIEQGHCQNGLYEDHDGHVCVFGAVHRARQEALIVTATGRVSEWQEYPFIVRAVGGNKRITEWNDHPKTTEAMAIGALHEAALLAKEAGE